MLSQIFLNFSNRLGIFSRKARILNPLGQCRVRSLRQVIFKQNFYGILQSICAQGLNSSILT